MGGVAVLHPQDVLRDRVNFNRMPLISPPSLKARGRNPNLTPNSNSNRRKRSPQKKNNDSSRSPPPKSSKGTNLVMGKVKILKRGEALTNDEKVLSRLGPEPADFYAGSAFDASPPPSSLPVPDFFFRKRTPEVDLTKENDESSSDLCRLLKLAGIEITP